MALQSLPRHYSRTGWGKVTVHPLQAIREGQEVSKDRWSCIVREGIIEVLKATGAYHADDLDHLGIPDEHRNIIGSQTAKLVNQKWTEEAGRRKSILPSRNGAKSGIYKLTALGKNKIVGVGGEGSGSERPDIRSRCDSDTPHSGETGWAGSGGGAGAETRQEPPGPEEAPDTSTASPEQPLVGVSAGLPESKGQGGLEEPDEGPATHSGEKVDVGGYESPCADVDPGSPEGVSTFLPSGEPARLPGFDESAAARRMRDAA